MAEIIQYKRELFDFVNNLTAINNSIAFERVDDRIVVRKADKNRTIPYILSVPSDYFDIQETVAFYKYDNFYRFLNSLKEPKLSINADKMTLSGNGVNIKYLLSDEEGIINGPKSVAFENGDVRFTLTKEDLDELTKLTGLVKGTKAKLKCTGTTITVTIYSSGSDNSFEKVFEGERVTDFEDDFEFVIFANRFEYLPAKHDYCIDLSHENFMRMSLIHDEIECNLYSGDIS